MLLSTCAEKGEWSESERERKVKNEQKGLWGEDDVFGVITKLWQKKCVC